MKRILILLPLLFVAVAYGQAPDLSKMDIVMRSIPPGPVAFVDGESISHDDFVRFYEARIKSLEAKNGEAPNDNLRVGVAIACLSELVQQAYLVAEAERRNIHVSDYEVSEAYDKEIKRLASAGIEPDAEPLSESEVLAKTKQTRAEARDAVKRSLRVQKAAEALMKEERIEVTDAEIKQFYENNKARFSGAANIHLKQILIKPSPTPRNATDEQWDEARKRIDKALARIRAGERFEAVAKDVSDAPNAAENGGDMGLLPIREEDGVIGVLVKAVTDVKPGGLSKVVRSEYGWHILKLVERNEAGGTSLEAATPQIRQFLEAARSEQALESVIQPILQDPERVRIFMQLPRTIASALQSGDEAR